MKSNSKNNQIEMSKRASGLTIVESLVAISILVVSVLGPLVIVSQAFKISFFARDQMTAYYLAQESLEYVRNIRDKNSLTLTEPSDWLTGIVEGGADPIVNAIDNPDLVKYELVRTTTGYKLKLCPGTPSVCPKVRFNSTTGIYGDEAPAGTGNSIFTREVTFIKAPDDDTSAQEVTVKVVMSWNQVGGIYKFPLHMQLTNWKIQNYNEN